MAREMNKLTKPKIKRLIEEGKPGRTADGFGLYLQISKWQTAAWVFRFMIEGKQWTMGLGRADPEGVNGFNLAEARKRAANARKMLKGGDDATQRINPIELKREARDKERKDNLSKMLFSEAVKRYVDLHGPRWTNPKYARQWQTTVKKYAGDLFNRPVAAIDGTLITETLAPIWTTKAVTARRVKERIGTVIKWVGKGMPLPNDVTVNHLPALNYERLPAFIAELRKNDSREARALEFMILVGARTMEVIDAEWSELNRKKKTWTCPGARLDENGVRVSGMKSKVEHRFALCDRAIEILDELPHEDGNPHMFIGEQYGKHLDKDAMRKLLKSMDATATPHGMRSAMATWAEEETNFGNDTARAQQSHGLKTLVQASYERGDLLRKRLLLVAAWQNFLDGKTDQVAEHRNKHAA